MSKLRKYTIFVITSFAILWIVGLVLTIVGLSMYKEERNKGEIISGVGYALMAIVMLLCVYVKLKKIK